MEPGVLFGHVVHDPKLRRQEEVIIRELTPDDLPELLSLAIKIFRDTFTHNNTPEAMEGFIASDYTIDKFTREFYEPGSLYFFVCDDNGKAIAYMRIRKNTEADHLLGSNNIELQRLYVDHSYHGRKIADRLMQLAIDIAKENKHDWIWLGVWEHNPRAQRFYQKWGFERFSEHDFYMGEEKQTDWLMRKDLRSN
jgi:ribosomal protein S18 acetylase RimI-like enzyme